MAGPTTTKKGANPAPDYQSTFNSIELLTSSRTRNFLLSSTSASHTKMRAAQQQQSTPTATTKPSSTSKPTTKPTSAAKTAALLAQAKAEEADLDRLAMDDDNAGVGLHGPGSGKTAEQVAKMREDRKLATRIMGKKRRAEEARSQRMRGEDAASSDDEPGRSGVGRAKKRVRRGDGATTTPAAVEKTTTVNGDGDGDGDVDTDMKDEGEEAAAVVAKIPGESSGEDKEADGDDHKKETGTSIGEQQKAIDGSNPDAEAQSKKKRKKKNKKKTKGAVAATAPPSDD